MDNSYVNENPFCLANDENTVIAYATTRLSFEPKGWQKDFRTKLRNAILHLHANENNTLLAKYGSIENIDYVDVENALFYNVGPSVFKNVADHSILFEKLNSKETSNRLVSLQCADSYSYYYEYSVTTLSDNEKLWWQKDLVAEWNDINIRKPHTDQKPLDYWRVLKMNPDAITIHTSNIIDGPFGLDISISISQGDSINLASIMKPLLDGVICAFHSYKDSQNSNVEKMCKRLECTTDMLLNTNKGVLGKETYIGDYRNGIKWSPQDDRCRAIKLSATPSKNESWSFRGKVFNLALVD